MTTEEDTEGTPSWQNIKCAINTVWDMRDESLLPEVADQRLLEALGILRITLEEETPTDEEKIDIYGLSAIICTYLQDWEKFEEFYKLVNSIKKDTLWAEIANTRSQFARRGTRNIVVKRANQAAIKVATIFKKYYETEKPEAFDLIFNAHFICDFANLMKYLDMKMDPFFRDTFLHIPWDTADTQNIVDPDDYFGEAEHIMALFNGHLTLLS